MNPTDMHRNNLSQEEMFTNELSAVFVRWYEESDLDDLTMAQVAIDVIERFCGTDVEFEPDFDFGEEDDE
tara:strand:- start:99 stop:308 length:210 start_codon:yes stop_codon:yes gene_type:complete